MAVRHPEEFIIRLATPDDVPRLLQMYLDFEPKVEFQGLPPPTEEKIEQWLTSLTGGGNVNFVIEAADGRIIGHAVLCREASDRAEVAIFLHQEFRGRGLGRKLMEAVIHFGCHCLHLRKIWLSVQTLNLPAVELYRKLGFVTLHDIGDVSSELLMERSVGCPVCRQEECPVFDKRIPLRITLPPAEEPSQSDPLSEDGRRR